MRIHSHLIPILVAAAAVTRSFPIIPTIEVERAIYRDGFLTVTGETQKANQRIGLDDRYFVSTNEHRQFRFHVEYVPSDCIITLTTDVDRQLAVVRGCDIGHLPKPSNTSPKETKTPSAPDHGSSSVSQ